MEYRILGPFDILSNGESVHLGGGRQRAFLALLVLNANTVVSIDRIIDSLWPDDVPETAANIIQVYVSRLRKLLEPERPKGTDGSILLTRRPGYLLHVEAGQLDATEFARLAAEGRSALESGTPGIAAAMLQQALDLWHGEVLADLAFEEFARSEIERLAEARLAVREDLIDARLAIGQHEEVIGDIEALVGEHPLREGLWAQLMVGLYRSGRQAEALRAYRRAADTLVEELGIDPSPRLQDLEEAILQQDPSLDLRQRPAAISSATEENPVPLIGREDELAALDDAVSMVKGGRRVLVTISGDEGSGIGRLLDEAARRAVAEGLPLSRAQAFAVSGSRPGEVVAQIARPESGGHAIVVAGAQWADPTSMGTLRRWVANGEGAPLLLVLGHQPVTGRAAKPMESLAAAFDAVGSVIALKVGRITKADLGRWVEPGLVEPLFELSGGYPFELRRALETLRRAGSVSWTDGFVRQVADLPEELAPSLAQKVASLDRGSRRLVEAAALAATPLPLSVAAALLEDSEEATLNVVESLVSDGYLDESEAGVAVSADLQSGRLTEHFGDLRRATLYGALADAFAVTDVERDGALVGTFALRAGRLEEAVDLLTRAGLAAVAAQHLGEAQPLLEGAIAALRRLGSMEDARWGSLHLALAQCHRLAGWPDLATGALREAIGSTRGVERIDALGWAAQIADDRQSPVEAEWYVAAGEWEALRLGELGKYGSLLSLRSRVLNRLGFVEEADHVLAKATENLDRYAGEVQRFNAHYNAAWIAFDRGDARTAEAKFSALVDSLRDAEDARVADLHAWWSRALFKTGRVDDALEARRHALLLGQRAGDVGPVFLAQMSLAEGASDYGRSDLALEAAAEMLGLVLQQLPAWENAARYLLARAHVAGGDLEAARDEVANAIDLCPPGAAGRRWRHTCRALQLSVEWELDSKIGVDLESFAKELTATRLSGPAIEVLTLCALVENNPNPARLAAELAVSNGLSAAAVRAVRAGNLTEGPSVVAATRMARAAWETMPEPWRQTFAVLAGPVLE